MDLPPNIGYRFQSSFRTHLRKFRCSFSAKKALSEGLWEAFTALTKHRNLDPFVLFSFHFYLPLPGRSGKLALMEAASWKNGSLLNSEKKSRPDGTRVTRYPWHRQEHMGSFSIFPGRILGMQTYLPILIAILGNLPDLRVFICECVYNAPIFSRLNSFLLI